MLLVLVLRCSQEMMLVRRDTCSYMHHSNLVSQIQPPSCQEIQFPVVLYNVS